MTFLPSGAKLLAGLTPKITEKDMIKYKYIATLAKLSAEALNKDSKA